MMSETAKYRGLTTEFCNGNGIDVGSGGDLVVPHAIGVDLESPYTSVGQLPIQWRGHAGDLPFKDGTLDFVYSSHLLEDFEDWNPILGEWVRVLKPGGHLVVVMPERGRWKAALDRGQPPNLAHKHEALVGELSGYAPAMGLDVLQDRLVDESNPLEYSLLFVARKR